MTHLIVHTTDASYDQNPGPRLSLHLTAHVAALIAQARDAAHSLASLGRTVYGIDVDCDEIHVTPVRVGEDTASSAAQWPMNPLDTQMLAPNAAALVTALPPEDETPGFWEDHRHRLGVTGLRVNAEHVSLFAVLDKSGEELQSAPIQLSALLPHLITPPDDQTRTFRFSADIDQLAECGSLDGLNALLDTHLSAAGHPFFSTDISYAAVGIDGDSVLVEATFVPSNADEQTDDPETSGATGSGAELAD